MADNETEEVYESSWVENPILVAVSPKIPALLSMIASYVLLREVIMELKSPNNRTCKPLLRFLLSMSISDIFLSMPW
eukprot:CAMPEP_0178849472 /NCGR_PEP_ID=MMETSP0746-20121128/19951_1 /TAXON_ID=913974 /ORGANISM="Nitzschia punctata, Strain CCMP561" /LENGTH=76 /DNA_ID=CAMNT_0020514661 /DNA_START=791 /DNA_END=1021 /DNA_ORIENTATION=+